MRMRAMRGVVLGCLWALAVPVGADVIDEDWEPPECDAFDCPPGSTAAALGHSSCPSVCAPTQECEDHASCMATYGEGSQCIPTRFCVGVAYSGPGMSRSVLDACDPAGPCGSAADESLPEEERPTCEEVRRCQPPAAPPTPPAQGGCAGCDAGTGSHAGLGMAMVGLALLRRRAL